MDEKTDSYIMLYIDRRIEDLNREELLEVVQLLGKELRQQRKETDRWRRAGDPLKYLLQA